MLRSNPAAASAALVLACILAVACGPAQVPRSTASAPASAPTLAMSDPPEYRDRPISAAAGAEYFGETGLGDPYAAGFPYPVLLAIMRAFPDELGADWAGFRARFGALARSGTSDDGTVL